MERIHVLLNNSIKITVTLICLLFFVTCPVPAQESSTPKILVLHSYHKSFSWTESIENGIVSEFREKKSNAVFQFEYMDTKRIYQSNYLQTLFELYKIKFKDIRFDIIICSDNNALNFLLSYHQVLFPDTPIVFCGINNFKDDILENQDLFTGTIEEIDFKSTLDIALKLHPKTWQIVFYGNDSPTYHANRALLEKLIPSYGDRVNFQFKNKVSLTFIQNDIQALEPDSLILIGAAVRTETGKLLSFAKYVRMMETVSHSPIYGCWEFFLGHGLVGGMIVSGFAQGKAAADIALRILMGEAVSDIPVLKKSPNQYMFDNDQLKKFSIDPLSLPKDTVIINRQLSFYARHWESIVIIVVIFAVLICINLILSSNIRSRKRTEKKLLENELHLRTLLNTMPELVWLKDPDGVYLSCNLEFERFFGSKESDIAGKTDFDFADKKMAGFFKKNDKKAIATGMSITNEGEITYADDGHNAILEVVKTPMYDFEGKLIGVLGIAHDITRRKQAEEEKIKAQKITAEQSKLALVGKIAGKMAHDFNNILGIVMGNTELALLDCKDSQIRETLKLIFKQTLRGKNLTKNLVAFAKAQEPRQHFFSVNKKIELVLNLLKKDLKGIDAIKEDGPGIPDLLADPDMIEHALVNIIQNSIHATSMIDQPRIMIRTFLKDKNICIEIEDNGCGIPEKALGKIYEPAFTLKGSRDTTNSYKPGIKGTGYGMANVKKYIEQHKGSIVIDSKVGEGTKSTICLPVIKKELTQKEIIEIQKENFYFEKYILVVEDERDISDVQYKILTHEPCNHRVDIAADGQMAIDLFDRNKYDFVSLDYILPGKLNGMNVYQHIRQSNDTLPILFVSGNLNFLESVKELKHKDPCVDHVSKPCQNKDYISSINELLEKT